jgi:hypothetical protein
VNGDYDQGINTLTTNQYVWFDGAVQSRIIHDTNTENSSNPSPTDPAHNYTSFEYNNAGQLQSAYIRDYLARKVLSPIGSASPMTTTAKSSAAMKARPPAIPVPRTRCGTALPDASWAIPVITARPMSPHRSR